MLVKIVIFGAFLLGTVLFQREFLLPKKIVIPVLFDCVWLFGGYLILLYLEIRSKVAKAPKWKNLRWTGFHFTFWAGFFWGAYFSSPAMHSWFSAPLRFIGYLVGWVVSGIVFGLLGMAITQFMLLIIFKLPDRE
jgi:hypothetical protein